MLKLKNIYFQCMASNGCGTHAVKLTSLHMGSLHLCRSLKQTHTEYRSEDQCSALIYVIWLLIKALLFDTFLNDFFRFAREKPNWKQRETECESMQLRKVYLCACVVFCISEKEKNDGDI